MAFAPLGPRQHRRRLHRSPGRFRCVVLVGLLAAQPRQSQRLRQVGHHERNERRSPWTTEVGAGGTNSATTGLRTPAGLSLYTTVIDGTTGQLRVYVNGARITQNAIVRDVASFGSTLVASLGRSTYNDTSWNGLVDDFAVYAQALTDADVQALYSSQALDRAVAGISVPTTATADFAVPVTSAGVPVTWASDNAAIAVSGTTATVTRPAAGAGDASVTLTATLTVNGETRTQTYVVLVPQQLADTEKVAQDLAAIAIANLDDIRTNFSVPTAGAPGLHDHVEHRRRRRRERRASRRCARRLTHRRGPAARCRIGSRSRWS